MLPHQFFFSSRSLKQPCQARTVIESSKAIQLWFAGGDQPPVLVGGIILNEVILPTDNLEPCLPKLRFSLIGRHFMMLSRYIPRTLVDRMRFAIDHNQTSARNQGSEHVSEN